MMIKMLFEEAGQYFYCEAKKTASHSYEGIVHFLHKVGEGNAFVRGKTCHCTAVFESRNDALTAAERYGKQLAHQGQHSAANPKCTPRFKSGTQNPTRKAAKQIAKSAC